MKTMMQAVSSDYQANGVSMEKAPAMQQITKQIVSNVLSSETLFGGANAVVIQHQDECYVLRLTKQNKLILTK